MIDKPLADFLEAGLSIHIGTCGDDLEPSGARAAAITVESDGQHIVVFVPQVAATRLLKDVFTNGQVAVSVGRPVDDRACQVKGVVLDVREGTPEEQGSVERQWEGFMRQLEAIGVSRVAAGTWASWPVTAFRLKVTAVFEQTPGPQAGVAIG